MRNLIPRCLLLAFFAVTPQLLAQSDSRQFHASIAPLPEENLASACRFDLWIANPSKSVTATWITYDRGFDISKYYEDPDVRAFAETHQLALMMAHQCPARNPANGEMDMDVSHGIGRTVSAALKTFAEQSSHSELSHSKLIMLGFSGTGVLFARLVAYMPDRVVAAILTAPEQGEPFGIEHIDLSTTAFNVPELIVVGGNDDHVGTQRPYDYFLRHWNRGAPWTFLVQNKIPHCCVINVKPLILEWLDSVIRLRKPEPDRQLRPVTREGWMGMIRRCENVSHDHWGEPLWNVCDAYVQSAGHSARKDFQVAGWLPTRKFARDWLTYIQQQDHSANSFPNPDNR
jgi:hypothetical protein